MQFKVVDRVIYHPLRHGNEDLEGWTGTVVYVDDTDCPYTVRFDDTFMDGLTDRRFSTKEQDRDRCWFCREENLELMSAETKTKKERKNSVKYTKEIDEQILTMRGEGKTAAEIAKVLGTTEQSIYSRCSYLRKFGREIAKRAPAFTEEKKMGEMNDLEVAMAETISELTAERDGLVDKLAIYEKDYGDLLQKNENCLSKIAEQAQTIEQMRRELEDTKEELARAEEQLDEERGAAETHLDKVREQVKTISSLESRVFGAESDLLAKDLEINKLKDLLNNRDGEIEELTNRLERAAEKAGQLLTQCLMLGD